MRAAAELDLRALVEERVAAVRAKDRRSLDARQAADVVARNVLPPLRSQGREAVTEQTRAWFDAYPGPIGYDVHDVEVWAESDLGFAAFVYRVTGTLRTGDEVDMWVRATLCCRRIEGTWQIVHDHESVPFDPATGLAVLDLQP